MVKLPSSMQTGAGALAALCLGLPEAALAQDQAAQIAALQQQIEELRQQVQALSAARSSVAVASSAPVPAEPARALAVAGEKVAAAPVAAQPAKAGAKSKAWYDKIQLRGYVQMRASETLDIREDAVPQAARLKSVHDAAIGEPVNFSLRRARLVVQGDLSDRVGIYLQSDFAAAVSNQSGGERREHFAQLRDAYVDLSFLSRTLKLRFGQSKVPYGWENLQSSSNRIAIDRADAANSAVPGERDLGVVAYYTPPGVQAIWDGLAKDGQKLFGNYGAFALGVFNGQGINRTDRTAGMATVAMVTRPFRLDGLGEAFAGQVLEVGAQGMLNKVRPELRSGGVSPQAYRERRVNLHAVLYPAPFGLQAEWNWGEGPEWQAATQSIATRPLNGGYVQAMYRVARSPVGAFIPYARWQYYRGGWKAATNAPRLMTDEVELGVEWQPLKELELTLAYANMKRAEADERRIGRAQGSLLRGQLQWSF